MSEANNTIKSIKKICNRDMWLGDSQVSSFRPNADEYNIYDKCCREHQHIDEELSS